MCRPPVLLKYTIGVLAKEFGVLHTPHYFLQCNIGANAVRVFFPGVLDTRENELFNPIF